MCPAPPEQAEERIQEAGEQNFKHESPLSKVQAFDRALCRLVVSCQEFQGIVNE